MTTIRPRPSLTVVGPVQETAAERAQKAAQAAVKSRRDAFAMIVEHLAWIAHEAQAASELGPDDGPIRDRIARVAEHNRREAEAICEMLRRINP